MNRGGRETNPRVWFLFAAWVSVTMSGAAQEPGSREPVRLAFAVPPGCPDEEVFWQWVSERTPGIGRSAEEAARLFEVSVAVLEAESSARTFEGRLRVSDSRDANPTERVLEGISCEEALEALALVTALAIDQAEQARIAQEQVVIPESRRLESSVRAPPVDPLPEPVAEWRTRIGASLDVGLSRSTDVTWGPSAILGLHRDPADRSFVEGPSGRLALVWSSVETEVEAQTARFAWWLLRVDGCPATLRVVPFLRIDPCVAFEAGVITASGERTMAPKSAVRPWFTAGPSTRLSFEISDEWTFELGAALMIALVRDRFHLASGATLLEPRTLQPVLDGGLSWTFP